MPLGIRRVRKSALGVYISQLKKQTIIILLSISVLIIQLFFQCNLTPRKETELVISEDKEKYHKAIKNHTKTIELDPKSAIAYNNRGYAWYCLWEYDNAIGDCIKAIDLNPELIYADKGRDNDWADIEEYDYPPNPRKRSHVKRYFLEALKCYKQYLFKDASGGWKKVLGLEKKHTRASIFFNKASKAYKESEISYYEGLRFITKEAWKNAIEKFQITLDINPNHKKAQYYIEIGRKKLKDPTWNDHKKRK